MVLAQAQGKVTVNSDSEQIREIIRTIEDIQN